MKLIRVSFLEVLYLLNFLLCYLFIDYTDGLGYMNGENFNYVKNLHSSGSDDDVSIFALQYVNIFFLIISIFSKRKYRVLAFYLLFTYLCLGLMQVAEIDSTILNGNYILFFMMTILLFLTIYFWIILIKKINNCLNL